MAALWRCVRRRDAVRTCVVGALAVALLPGCGASVNSLLFAGSSRSPATTTTTAVLAVAGPLALTVSPAEAPAGTSFHLRATGLGPTDVVTFSIVAQGGHPYTGPTHVPGADGSVDAMYESSAADAAGLYVVLAHTAAGRGAFASFRVDAPHP